MSGAPHRATSADRAVIASFIVDGPWAMTMPFFVYMLASRKHGTLYVGVTNDLVRRVSEHKQKLSGGFTARHGIDRLVWYEAFDDPTDAIRREKAVKRWRRAWKIAAIDRTNPEWRDLFEELTA